MEQGGGVRVCPQVSSNSSWMCLAMTSSPERFTSADPWRWILETACCRRYRTGWIRRNVNVEADTRGTDDEARPEPRAAAELGMAL